MCTNNNNNNNRRPYEKKSILLLLSLLPSCLLQLTEKSRLENVAQNCVTAYVLYMFL